MEVYALPAVTATNSLFGGTADSLRQSVFFLPRSIANAFPASHISPSQLRAAYDTLSTFSTARTSPSEQDLHSSRERRKNQNQLASRLVDRPIATGFNFVEYEIAIAIIAIGFQNYWRHLTALEKSSRRTKIEKVGRALQESDLHKFAMSPLKNMKSAAAARVACTYGPSLHRMLHCTSSSSFGCTRVLQPALQLDRFGSQSTRRALRDVLQKHARQ